MLHITKHKKNTKMESFYSLNTSSLTNSYCIYYSKNSQNICYYCYSHRQCKRYTSLEKHNINNSYKLAYTNIEMQFIPYKYLRLNSFGELINYKHIENLCKLAFYNNDTTFSLFTKRYDLISEYFHYNVKPKNLIIVLSSLKLNEIIHKENYSDIIDKTFSVVEKNSAKAHYSNCLNKCNTCFKCYTHNNINNIIEVKKIKIGGLKMNIKVNYNNEKITITKILKRRIEFKYKGVSRIINKYGVFMNNPFKEIGYSWDINYEEKHDITNFLLKYTGAKKEKIKSESELIYRFK